MYSQQHIYFCDYVYTLQCPSCHRITAVRRQPPLTETELKAVQCNQAWNVRDEILIV